MEIEKEIRYEINLEQINKIIENTESLIQSFDMLDITFGYNGFDSYKDYGFICRVREKNNIVTLEVKNYTNENECTEQAINLENKKDGYNYLKLIGMSPYLYLRRNREVRTYKNLKIFIDKFDILGNYIEIEYQDSNNNELNEFIKLINLKDQKDMYGSIVKEKLKDKKFKEIFIRNLNDLTQK